MSCQTDPPHFPDSTQARRPAAPLVRSPHL
jgi:hypothetical protein